MTEAKNPELHVNEEPRNDLIDVGVGFLAFIGFMLAVSLIATIITIFM